MTETCRGACVRRHRWKHLAAEGEMELLWTPLYSIIIDKLVEEELILLSGEMWSACVQRIWEKYTKAMTACAARKEATTEGES